MLRVLGGGGPARELHPVQLAQQIEYAARQPRFERVQEFASYARLVKGRHESAGKVVGGGGAKQGNVHLKWAFSEAAVTFLRQNREGQRLKARLERRHGKGKALSILAHKIGRAVYHMLARHTTFSMERFLAA